MAEDLRLWIDTDPALGVEIDGRPRDVDDAFVIVEAVRNPRIDLAGISVVSGNAPAERGFAVACELLRMTGSSVPVVKGADRAEPPGRRTRNEAVAAMAQALEQGPLSMIAIGPLGNVASLVEHHPDAAARIRELVVVAGRSPGAVFELHGATGIPDFNFECDPEAARTVLESGIPVVLAGFELTHRVAITREHLEAARERSAVARHLVEGALPWLRFWQQAFPQDAGFHPWDSAALAWLLHPGYFAAERRGFRIRPAPGAAPDAPATPWLELGAGLPGPRHTYVHDFAPGGAEAFVAHVVDAIR